MQLKGVTKALEGRPEVYPDATMWQLGCKSGTNRGQVGGNLE